METKIFCPRYFRLTSIFQRITFRRRFSPKNFRNYLHNFRKKSIVFIINIFNGYTVIISTDLFLPVHAPFFIALNERSKHSLRYTVYYGDEDDVRTNPQNPLYLIDKIGVCVNINNGRKATIFDCINSKNQESTQKQKKQDKQGKN